MLLEEHERLKAVQVITTPSGKKVLDFGQNIAGYIEFRLNAKAGQKLNAPLRRDVRRERANSRRRTSNASKRSARAPLQQIEYTCREGVNEYKTRFAIFGFQYALVEGDAPWKEEDFTAIAVYSSMESTVAFESSNALLNKFVENTRWSAKNNHADIPTDCPTRERHGWTGDAQIFVKDGELFLRLRRDGAQVHQRHAGRAERRTAVTVRSRLPGGVDRYMDAMDGSAGWSDAGVFIPYFLWKMYGDERILKESYASMQAYAKYKIKTLGKHYLTSLPTGVGLRYRKYICNYGQSYGEWSEPADVHPFAISDFVSPHPEESTAYVVLLLERMAEIASALGKKEDEAHYKKYAERARTGYRKLVSGKKFSLDTDRQAKLVRPLYLRLLDKRQETVRKGPPHEGARKLPLAA